MTNHTARSLGFYIGNKVYVKFSSEPDLLGDGVRELTAFELAHLFEFKENRSCSIYPVLKTADHINEKNWDFIFKDNVLKLMTLTLKEETHKILHPKILERIIEVNGIAIPDKNSPTGYSDLLGYPCVTEEIINKK